MAFGRYVTYEIKGAKIKYTSEENTGNVKYIDELGAVYSYDDERIIYDPEIRKGENRFKASGYTTTAGLDYDLLLRTYTDNVITYQNENMSGFDSYTITAISVEALNEYMLHGQDETYLGISTETIYNIETRISDSVFYYVDGETGAVTTLNVQSVLDAYKAEQEAQAQKNSETIWSIINYITGGIMVATGVILIVTPFAAAAPSLIVGGTAMIAMETNPITISPINIFLRRV